MRDACLAHWIGDNMFQKGRFSTYESKRHKSDLTAEFLLGN